MRLWIPQHCSMHIHYIVVHKMSYCSANGGLQPSWYAIWCHNNNVLVTWAAITWLQSCTLLTWALKNSTFNNGREQTCSLNYSHLVPASCEEPLEFLVLFEFWQNTWISHFFEICWVLARKFKCVKWYLFLGWDSNLVNFSATFNLESFKLIRQATKIPNNYSIMSIFYFSFEMVFVLCKPEAAFLMVVQL